MQYNNKTAGQYSIVVVEDNDATRARLIHVLSQCDDLAVVGEAANVANARAIIAGTRPGVVLVDLGLPDGNGIDLIRETRQTSPATEIMVITIFGDEHHVVSAIEAGASGYLIKDGEAEYIADSVRQLLAGGSPISASIARHLLKRFQPQPPDQQDDVPTLTAREHEVLELVAKGLSYAEIGNVLSMSTHTVTSHIKHIYRKLSVNSRGQAVFEAMQLGLIDKPV